MSINPIQQPQQQRAPKARPERPKERSSADRLEQDLNVLARAQREIDHARTKGWLMLFAGFALGLIVGMGWAA